MTQEKIPASTQPLQYSYGHPELDISFSDEERKAER